MGLRGAVFLISWARCSKNVSCVGYVRPPILVGSWLLLAHLWVWLPLWIDPEHNVWAAVWELAPQGSVYFTRVWCLLRPPFICAACGAYWVVLWCSLNNWLCWFWIPLGDNLVLVNIMLCLWWSLGYLLGATMWSTVLWLPLLSLDLCGRSLTMHQGQFSSAYSWLGVGGGQQMPMVSWDKPSPAKHPLGSVPERVSGST